MAELNTFDQTRVEVAGAWLAHVYRGSNPHAADHFRKVYDTPGSWQLVSAIARHCTAERFGVRDPGFDDISVWASDLVIRYGAMTPEAVHALYRREALHRRLKRATQH